MPAYVEGDRAAFYRKASSRPVRFNWEIGNTDFTQSRRFGSYQGSEVQWIRNKADSAKLYIRPSHPMAQRVQQCNTDVVPMRTYYNGKVWDGRVHKTRTVGKPGSELIEVQLVSNWKWAQRILGYPQPLLPEWIQVPTQDVMVGDLDFVTKWFFARNSSRLGIPVYVKVPAPGLPDLGAPQLGLTNMGGVPELSQIIKIISDFDLVALYSRMTVLADLVEESFMNSDRELTINLWKEGDPDPGRIFNTEGLGRLQNILDLSGESLFYFANPNNMLNLINPTSWGRARGTCYIVDTKKKRDRRHMRWTTRGGDINWIEREITEPEWHTALVGGKSPDIVNNMVEMAANMAIQALLTAVGFPAAGVLIGDLLDNILFAFNKYTDVQLKADFKNHGWPETFRNASAAFTLDSLAGGLAAIEEGAGKDQLAIEVYDGGLTGKGYEFGLDNGSGRRYDVGDIMTFDDRGVRMEEYVSAVTVTDNRTDVMKVRTVLGDEDPALSGALKVIGKVKSLVSLANAVAVSTG